MNPNKSIKRLLGFISGSHKTKMEMSIKKQMKSSIVVVQYTNDL